ncbi:MAG: S41 family peptidase [Gammaproteobacteria bacterium]
MRHDKHIFSVTFLAVARAIAAGALLAALAACGGSDDGGSLPVEDCTNPGQVATVLDAMDTFYFWNDVPEQRDKYRDLDIASFADTDELLDFLRYLPDEFDRLFTNIGSIEQDTSFFGPGEFVGYGFSFSLNAAGDALDITQVFAGSPADAAGFARGISIVAVDGRTIPEIEAAEGVEEAFGESEVGITQQITLQSPGGQPFVVTPTKATVTIDPVPQHRVIDVNGRMIGYIEFRAFISTAPTKLTNAFADFVAAGVTDVIVDARYNGGGLLSVAEFFASLLAGPANVGRVQSITRYNVSNRFRNFESEFSAQSNSIDLASIVFITTNSSASATEVVINSLEPYVDIALVGADTFGKPVGQDAFDFCAQRLRLVTFENLNANQQGGFFDGLPVDCPADDDLALPLGDAFEDSLATALGRINTGACPITSTPRRANLLSVAPRRARDLRSTTAAREFAYAY